MIIRWHRGHCPETGGAASVMTLCTMRATACLFLVLLGTLIAVEFAGGWQASSGYDIAYLGECGEGGAICRMHSDGSQPSLMVQPGGGSTILRPNWWSPDGRKILYFGSNGVHLASADGSKDDELPIKLFGLEIQMVWSPDSTRVAFSSPFEDPHLSDPEIQRGAKMYSTAVYVIDVQTKKVSRLSPLGQNRWISWSPDGRRIVYTGAELDGAKSGVYVVDAVVDSGQPGPRLIYSGRNLQPVWSPKSDLIAFIAPQLSLNGKENDVFVVAPDGSKPRRITGTWNLAAWSPDGRFLLANSRVVDIASGATVQLAEPGPITMLDATFAPDGRSIIYRTMNEGNGTISAIDVDGKNRRKLSDTCCAFVVSPLLRR